MNKTSKFLFLIFFWAGLLFAQSSEVVFVQMNDVYEIAPIEGGKYGGLARVSTLNQKLVEANPYTYLVLSGDFISPSALGTSEYNGEKINGAQMIDVLNAIGLNFAVFGNHEFDYKQDVLQKRINESNFQWISSNVKTKHGEALWKFGKNMGSDFNAFPEYYILKVPGYLKGQNIRIGIAAVCTNNNKQPYVIYEDYNTSAKRVYDMIKDSIDCFVAMTHLAIEDDRELAKELPQINLIMGGHEHVDNFERVGNTIIAKADANARTVYVHKLVFDINNKLADIKSELVSIDGIIPEDPKTKEVVELWVNRADEGFKSKGFDPGKLVTILSSPLDGRDESIREKQNDLGKVINLAMLMACLGCEISFFNAGSVRIDDELNGEVTQYDIIRTLPFGGKIIEVELKGSLLIELLNAGKQNAGSGGYLQYWPLQYDSTKNVWFSGNDAINPGNIYKAAVAAYLLTGLEQKMSFFTKDNPGIIKITSPDANDTNDLRNDVRLAVIKYLDKIRQK